jgi:hypothetical protein
VNFDTDGYQAIKETIRLILCNEFEEGKHGHTSGFIILPLNRGTEVSIRCVFANAFLPFGTQCDTANQWLEHYRYVLEDANLPVKIEHVPSDGSYDFPYLHIKPVLVDVKKKKYSLV